MNRVSLHVSRTTSDVTKGDTILNSKLKGTVPFLERIKYCVPFNLTAEIDNRLFYGSLVVSFTVHAALITGPSLFTQNIKIFEKPVRTIEVTYDAIKNDPNPQPQSVFKDVELSKPKEPPSPPPDVKVLSRKHDDIFSSFQNDLHEVTKSAQRVELSEKDLPGIKGFGGERKISVPLLQSEKITNPKYLSYTQNIRQRIKQRAYYYADNPDFASGEVYLTFVLSSSGALEGVKIIKEKTHSSAYVQNIGMRSIEESAPFPPFPPDLAFPELTFNVIISFELTDE